MGLVREHEGVRPYDFQRPHQLSRGQLDAVTTVLTTFWRSAANVLATYLRTPVQLQHMTVEQVPYEEMLQTIKVPAVLGVFNAAPNPGSAMIECAPMVALAMVDRSLGGPGVGEMPSRRLTEIEQSIIRRLFERILAVYRDVWQPMAPIEPKMQAMEHNPSFAQVAAEGDLVVVARQQVGVDGHRGHLALVWPYANIEPLAEAALKYQLIRDGTMENVVPKPEAMLRHVEAAPVTGSVLLGRTDITLGDFSQLKVGDAVILKNRYDQPLMLRLSNREKFLVLPGKSHGKLAVRVISRMEEE
ncbi:flagellar motor switch protein FliM [Sulfobacillus harzensis]|uniref:Flagellar motor switch protein FliM n=1 Tax=Sulfobacillus harzensis TaxID=2729629 RepID=A0A7Y0L505_9FIRM|nr:FliM/FliN family flagellar motor switch protein [Sulfobacillus harzensis]NMP23077.1 flagellar motor switch protein FliM [Sulfobacillus harzensis]